ncbi:MAG: ATP-dependent DNA helicase RecG [Microscillaceae bacterium]|nr:ATP-dependent DNA helicase RecG [Microscillaceae bacterium]MDW8460033.1 ATP-dependent DNA helicase RecG [Cytophagales bacterium]
MNQFLETKIEFLKGVGTAKATLLNKELHIFTFADLLWHLPYKHEDRTKIYKIIDLDENLPPVQVKGLITRIEILGEGSKQRLVAYLTDGSSEMELIWFQGIAWVKKSLQLQVTYLVFGKVQFFNNRFSMVHPEIELFDETAKQQTGFLQPVYHTTEVLKKKFISSKVIAKWIRTLLEQPQFTIEEFLPSYLVEQYKFLSPTEALRQIHFPQNSEQLHKAKFRLKFEELFLVQIKLLSQKTYRKIYYKGQVFQNTHLLTKFYNQHLPFELTNAQKRVVKEIYKDMTTGKQMNRLLQGDVGSGKTIVAFLSMLIALSNQAQACMMAPTELLAEQHFHSLKTYAEKLGITIDLLTGSTSNRERRIMHERLMNGNLKILIGTHALIEDSVQFENLGLCIIDEQHRFGVEQRARLWQKTTSDIYPHILVMTATPIPRTLALTLYGDLDLSIIDELPKGRKPVITAHRYESHRLRVYEFLRKEIKAGRQVYIVYPLIEESEKLDYKNLHDGYAQIKKVFPEYEVGMIHGKMSSAEKDLEMQRFKRNETQIMVATTVIEVGVDVPNATVMVIEDAQRFGLSQLHQLRGRVGRGAEQSYCILMTDYKLSKESKIRIETMVRTNNGFEIADVDMQLRGPGDIMGKQQSGMLNFLIANLAQDAHILQEARHHAQAILDKDALLTHPEHQALKQHLEKTQKEATFWSRVG